MPSSLPPTSALPHLATPDLTKVLDVLFEPSSTLHSLSLPVLRSAPFPDYPTLISAVTAQLSALASSTQPQDAQRLDQILGAHPRLGAKKVDSELSQKEQAQLHAGHDDQGRMLDALNAEYEAKFPGLRYVYVFLSFVYVNSPTTWMQQSQKCH